MATNEILNFADSVAPAANVQSQANYTADPERPVGNQAGTVARSDFNNKLFLQTSAISAGMGQFMADYQATDITDQLTSAQMSTTMCDAVRAITSEALPPYVLPSDLSPNNLIVNLPGAIPYTAYTQGDVFYVEARVNNTGAMTININSLGAQDILVPSGIGILPMSAAQWRFNGVYQIIYDGTQFQCINPSLVNSYIAILGKTNVQLITGNNVPMQILYNVVDKQVSDPAFGPWADTGGSFITPTTPGWYKIGVLQTFENYSDITNSDYNIQLQVYIDAASIGLVSQASLSTNAATLDANVTLYGSKEVFLSGSNEVTAYAALDSPGETAEIAAAVGQSSSTLTVQFIGS